MQPGRALVVELGQRALGQVFFMAESGDDAVGVRRCLHAQRNDFGQALRPLRRVDSVSKSFVNAKAKRRQYRRTASEADKVHG